MLNQIFTHTPLYVWVILAFLIFRGVIAMRTRELAMNKLFIIPLVMLALSLFDIAAKFGLGGIGFATWTVTMAATLALLVRFGAARIAPTAKPGHVVVLGSKFPLALMMAIFVTKYVTSIAVVVQPHLRENAIFTVAVCALFGLFSGYFLGRLARDLKAYQGFSAQLQAI
ncbi:DUF6622 family protein [Massilia sp. S19_KUP03_FR1]|uniref:DUF6622 family protein n=1 Tax=Massilia sp. S19_KUP03_FR1 TaxID=3025503 RepID=UPI002FCCC326